MNMHQFQTTLIKTGMPTDATRDVAENRSFPLSDGDWLCLVDSEGWICEFKKISQIKVGFYQVTGVKLGHLGRVVWAWANCLRLLSPKHLLTHSSKSDRSFIRTNFGSLPKHDVHLKIDVSLAQCLLSLLRVLQTDWMMPYTKRAVYVYHWALCEEKCILPLALGPLVVATMALACTIKP